MVSLDSLRFEKVWLEHQNRFLKLLSIPSVYDETTADKEHPYGVSVNDALCFMKDVLKQDGFDVKVYDNIALSASYGSGERVDIVSHLDVVSPGDGWEYGPFVPTVKDDRIIARGSQDMKSGVWLTYLALKMLKDEGIPFTKEMRIVLGTDEERTMDDMRHYVKCAGLPSFAFTPDGRFPITIGEKGACMWTMAKQYTGNVVSMHAGVQPNVVSPEACASVKKVKREDAERLMALYSIKGSVTAENELTVIRTIGAPAHASTPEAGHSATTDLLKLLAELTGEEDLKQLYALSAGMYGEGCDLIFDIAPMGRLTINPGVITIKDGSIYAMVDCRYPYGVTSDTLHEIFKSHYPNYDVQLPYDDPATLVEEDDPYIRALKKGYEKALHEPCGTEISGGVSYSKVFGHCVNFGPVAERSEKLAHQRNESILIRDCVEALAVYYEALKELMEV